MVKNKVLNTILEKNLIEKGEHIIVGISGGPDSVCLFHVLLKMQVALDIKIYPVHINHKFRPGEAEADQAYTERFCLGFGLTCRSFIYDCNAIAKKRGLTSEEAGREARYDAFYKVANEIRETVAAPKIKIAVAQNLNDQAETMIMRIIRGTGTEGLCGIEYKRQGKYDTQIIRPLLDVSRPEIEEYCYRYDLKPCIDKTNLEPIYTRNKIRLELIPEIEKSYNSNFTEAINRLSKIAKEDKDYFDGQVQRAIIDTVIEQSPNHISFKLGKLRILHPAIRHRLIMKAFEKIGLSQGIGSVHMELGDNLIEVGNTSSSADFPKGYAMEIGYDKVVMKRVQAVLEKKELKYVLKLKILNRQELMSLTGMEVPNLEMIAKGVALKKGCLAALDLESVLKIAKGADLEKCLIARNREAGDYIVPSGMTGTKKLQNFFVDKKIIKESRDLVPVVAIGNEIIWIIGDDSGLTETGLVWGRVSEKCKMKADSKHILLLEFSEKLC